MMPCDASSTRRMCTWEREVTGHPWTDAGGVDGAGGVHQDGEEGA